MKSEKISEIFYLLIEEDAQTAERKELYSMLCSEGKSLIESMIDERISEDEKEKYSEMLESAAAASAYYNLALLDEARLPESISSSELKITMGDRAERAHQLFRDRLKAAGPVLKCNDFFFGSVKM